MTWDFVLQAVPTCIVQGGFGSLGLPVAHCLVGPSADVRDN